VGLKVMPLWIQHAFVLSLVAGSITIIGRQAVQLLKTRKGGFGSCCAKGCDADQKLVARGSNKVIFIPIESLQRPRK
jgi:hypothetical protein